MADLESRVERTVGKLGRVVAGLERATATDRPTSSRPGSAREWVELFECLESQGFFINEPDFPTALELLRAAVVRDGSKDAMHVELEWLLEIYMRVTSGEPPVTESEYESLKEWYLRHESSRSIYDPSIRDALINTYTRGPRRLGATRTVAMMRRLRAEHPELD
jgi:hypothetical protein